MSNVRFIDMRPGLLPALVQALDDAAVVRDRNNQELGAFAYDKRDPLRLPGPKIKLHGEK